MAFSMVLHLNTENIMLYRMSRGALGKIGRNLGIRQNYSNFENQKCLNDGN